MNDSNTINSTIMFFRFLLCFCLVIHIIQGKTDEEVRAWFFRQALECNKDHPVSPEDLQMLQKHQIPDTANVKCLTACVFRKAKYLDSKGMFDVESASAESFKLYEGDATKVENSKKLMDICGTVNSETVTDGEAGCERAILLFKCFNLHAPELGFKMQP